jgi:hypothetical protein
MTKKEMNESIPPAYTQLIGEQLLAYLLDVSEPTVRRRA